jgi:hypothetical protein
MLSVVSEHTRTREALTNYLVVAEDESLKIFLGCPPDEVQVHSATVHTPHKNEFVASFRIRMFQKRLRANPTQKLGMEFIAKGTSHTSRYS